MKSLERRTLMKGLMAGGLITLFAPMARSGERLHVVVIGAGIAGLSAAFDLQQAGIHVTVLEKSPYPGGRMAETMRGPIWYPTGASGIFEANREMYALAAELGLVDELNAAYEYPEYSRTNTYAKYLAHLRWHSTEVMNVPGMSADTRAAIPSILPDLAAIRASVDPCLLSTGITWDTESVQEYFSRRLGTTAAQQVVEYWVQPGLDPWCWYAEETSMIAWLSVVAQQDARWIIPRSGVGFLTRALARRLDVRLNTTVRFVDRPNEIGRRPVHFLNADRRRESVTPDIVICAVEGNFILPLIRDLDSREMDFFRQIHMSEWAGVAYVLHPRHVPQLHGENYTDSHPNRKKWKLAGWGTSAGDPNQGGSPPTVWVSLDRSGIEEWRASGVDLGTFCRPRLKAVFSEFDEGHVEDTVFLGKDDMLLYIPTGLPHEMAAFLQRQETSRRTLYFAGEFLSHAHTGGACASGRTVARTILRHWA